MPKKNIFLSASVPLEERDPKYFESADVIAIRDAVIALASAVLANPSYHMIWGGHPSITPLITLVLDRYGLKMSDRVTLYQSREFERFFPPENKDVGIRKYTDKKGELRPCYSLTKTECLYIATKFNDEARARLVLRWEELELAERERWMAQQGRAHNMVDLRGSKGAQVFFVVPSGGTLPVPMRLIEYRPYHGPVRDLVVRTAHGIVREGTEDYTLYVRISKVMCEAVDVTPREMFEHEVYQLLKKMEEQTWN